ncbi:MAG: hypothetical protein JST64_13575 [Actinobacteria bacterium]|nr:hypothetical protein [Actinomycetota bacterium]
MILPLSLIDMDNIDKYTDEDLLKVLREHTPYSEAALGHVINVLRGEAPPNR